MTSTLHSMAEQPSLRFSKKFRFLIIMKICNARVTPSTVDPGVTAVEPGRPRWLYRGLPGWNRKKNRVDGCLEDSHPGVNMAAPGVNTADPGVNTADPGVNTADPGVNTVPISNTAHPGVNIFKCWVCDIAQMIKLFTIFISCHDFSGVII